jgi:hypothetical protein
MTAVGIGRQELADKVAMSRVNFNAVEARPTRQAHSSTKIEHQLIDL